MRNQNQMLSEKDSRALLHDKVAVIFGAGGAIGSGVVSEFSHEGASVFLSGRRLNLIEKIEIRASGKAYPAEIDASNRESNRKS